MDSLAIMGIKPHIARIFNHEIFSVFSLEVIGYQISFFRGVRRTSFGHAVFAHSLILSYLSSSAILCANSYGTKKTDALSVF